MSIRIICPAFRLAKFLIILFHPMTHSICLLPVAVNIFVLMGTVQTVSTAHLNLCQRVVNRHTIIDSRCASSSSEPFDTLFVPIRINMLRILPGFISSTIQNSWAIVASPKAITVVIQEVLKFWSTLAKLSPSIRCDVPSGGCCRFTAGLQVDRLKQARESVSGTPVKQHFNWLFFCTSITHDTFFIGISRIFLSGTLELFVGNVVSLTPVLVIISWKSCTLPLSSIVP